MDDDPIIRELTKQSLEFLGYHVETTENGEEAIDLYRNFYERGQRVHAVLLDINVTDGMGGVEAGERIMEIDRRAVLIVTSGQIDRSLNHEMGNKGIKACLAKPFKIAELQATLSQFITE